MTHEESSLQTKKALCQALKELMKHKAFSKITVSELIRECNVNRKTFYYHFTDIYDLLRWMLDEEALEVVRHFDLVNEYDKAIRFLVDYVESNAYFLNSIYDSVGHEVIQRLLGNDIRVVVEQLIDETISQMHVEISDDFRSFLIELYLESTVSIIVNFFRNPERYNKEKMMEYCEICIPKLLPASIQAYSEKYGSLSNDNTNFTNNKKKARKQ